YVAQRNHGRSMRVVGTILLLGRMAQADLFLVVEPRLVVRTKRRVRHPLDEPFLHPARILFVALAFWAAEPFHVMFLLACQLTPGIDHGFGAIAKDLRMPLQDGGVFIAPADRLLKLPQLFE